jgi:putative oxidoreductase
MDLLSHENDWVLLAGRLCLAAVFAVSAWSKFRQEPAEIKLLISLHIPAPGSAELAAGVCEAIGVVCLVLGIYVRTASLLLAVFMLTISFLVLTFWSAADPPPVRAQKRTAFFSNIAIIGGLLYVISTGPGRFAIGM